MGAGCGGWAAVSSACVRSCTDAYEYVCKRRNVEFITLLAGSLCHKSPFFRAGKYVSAMYSSGIIVE